MIARFDNSGLGTLSWEFARHLRPDKVLLVENGQFITFPERYKDFEVKHALYSVSQKLKDWLLTDIDILFTAETFYDWSLVKECRSRGVKSILYTMYEMTHSPMVAHPDLFLCPSRLDYDVMPEPKKYLPVPLATDRLIWQKRTKAHTFIHSASHGGMSGRKGTQLFLDAIPLVKNQDVKFKIFAWKDEYKIPNDKRVEFLPIQFQNYWQLWREGDVLVYPQDYNGICLPVVEAMASGLGVITTDIYPFNEYMPRELLFGHRGKYKTRAAKGLMETEAVKISSEDIAVKIDEWANKDISKFSLYGKNYAKAHSWDVLLPKYEKLFNNI